MDSLCRRFEGRIVLVTGAARGIGLAVAMAFAKEGAVLAVNDVSEENLRGAIAAIREISPKSVSYRADITNAGEVREMVEMVERDLGCVDILVNNAGIALPTGTLDISEQEWDRVMSVNLKGAFLVSQRVIALMIRKQRKGNVVMMGSLSGKMGGVATGLHYSVSKGGLIVMARQLAREFAKFGINVNAVAPSFADTDMLRDLKLEGKKEELARMNVIPRLATPDDIANAVLFLSSDSSSFITGETINVAGGRLMD
ncbi:MAG: SDR family NAD(P)-dependent oxidoreductase [Nitrososphaerales archaeon]|jgi:3-oxoacyl-[acyl-carrier protein] reductase